MVLNPTKGARRRDSNSDMCQSATDFGLKRESDPDDEFKWEEFFGTSVDIASALLDMFDTIAAKNNPSIDSPPLSLIPPAPLGLRGGAMTSAPPCDPGGALGPGSIKHPTDISAGEGTGSNHTGRRPPYSGKYRSYSDSAFMETQRNKRPLSTSSVSSSSSSSSSSLPRNGLDVKKSYLASIESLDDDFAEESGSGDPLGGPASASTASGGTNAVSSASSGATGGKPRWFDPNLSHTERVLLEIVDTERTYVRDLDEIIQGYLKHITRVNHPKVSHQYLEELFSNIEDIYKFNRLFVEELEQCGMNPVAAAQCFVKNSNGFEVYTQYCTNYPRTVSVLTELMGNCETAEIFKERQMALQHSLPLGSYLLKPVQRILKYHLLLQNMVKHSDKDSNGCVDIKNALSVMTGIAYHINDMKRKHEHAVRVQEIQSLLYGWEGQDLTTYGELVAEGAFRMYRAKALRHLFLFDKMILIAKKKEEGILSYKTHIMCSNLMLIESIQGEPLCFHVIPFDNPRYQYTFQARNLEQKREWCLQLKRVILENYNAVIPSHARQLVMELGQSKQEDHVLEKSTRRQLSAPEYLEKRKQERRKSEINLNRAFKLKKGSKKADHILNNKNNFPSGRRKSSSVGESWASQTDRNGDRNSWTKSQDDMSHSEDQVNGYSSSSNNCLSSSTAASYNPLLNRDCRLRHSLPQPSLSQRTISRERRFRPSWRAWNSVPEETTDTENEDLNDRIENQRSLEYHPAPRSHRNQTFEEPCDNSGEYVTFFYAHAYATRDMHENDLQSRLSLNCVGNGEQDNQNKTLCDDNDDASSTASNPSLQKSVSRKLRDQNKAKKSHRKVDCDNSSDAWAKPGTRQKDQDSESCSSGYSWKQSAAVRRVQSFTGMAKAKVASLHHNISFKHHSSSYSEPRTHLDQHSGLPPSGALILPLSGEDASPTTPAAWLKLQEEHLANGAKKSGSLPRSFQLATECVQTSLDTSLASHSDDSSVHRLRLRTEGQKCPYTEQRPFTIASDKPTHADFPDDMDRFVLECSPDTDADYCFLVRKDSYEHETTTGCTNTPAVSMENIHSIHPELKIYHQAASKYSTLKHVFSSMGSKIAGLRAAFSHQLPHDQADSCSNISVDGDLSRSDGRCSSRSSIKSESELGPKIFTAKLAHSVAKAYSAVVKHRSKKNEAKLAEKSIQDSKLEKSQIHTYKSESSLIGARMAHPLESEYSVPSNFISSHQLQKWKDDLRPDSLFSEYSNATSSSDGDKAPVEGSESTLPLSLKIRDEGEDTISEASESSADSYYERTFDAIENALAEDMFRDSAIYSDPEDADFSAVEVPKMASLRHLDLEKKVLNSRSFNIFQNGFSVTPKVTTPRLDLMCKRPVNQAILERLRILEENVKCQREEVAAAVESKKAVLQKRLDLEKWCYSGASRDFDESETSSEHSASTVNTVMESGSLVSNSTENSRPRIKGWVKHVVDKLQGEGHV